MRRARSLGRFAASFAVALLLLLVMTAGVHAAPRAAGAAHPGGTDDVSVTVGTAFAFTVSPDEVTPGDQVAITITQTDDVPHTFTLSPIAGFTFNPSTNTTTDLNNFFRAHPPLVNVTIPAGQATIHVPPFTAPPFGIYEYVCLVAPHFQAGMYGFLGSGEHGGGAAAAQPPGAPVFIIGGTIAGLVVLTIVLAFVVGRRQGTIHEMPPERLGYPEAPTAPKSPPSH